MIGIAGYKPGDDGGWIHNLTCSSASLLLQIDPKPIICLLRAGHAFEA